MQKQIYLGLKNIIPPVFVKANLKRKAVEAVRGIKVRP